MTKNDTDSLRASLAALPFISPAQMEQWVELQGTIDRTRDYLIRAVPQAQFSIDEAQKILAQRTYTPVSYTHLTLPTSDLV